MCFVFRSAIPVNRRMDGFTDEDEQLTDEQKHAKIRGTILLLPSLLSLTLSLSAHSQKLAGECRHEVITLKRALQNAQSLEDVVPIAKAIRDLIPVPPFPFVKLTHGKGSMVCVNSLSLST